MEVNQKIMIITNKNPKGGHPIEKVGCSLHNDGKGHFGFLVGYVDENVQVGEKILIPISTAKEVACRFAGDLEDFRQRFKPKETLRQRIIRWLGGNLPPAVDNF